MLNLISMSCRNSRHWIKLHHKIRGVLQKGGSGSLSPLQDPTVWAAWPYTRPAKDHAGHAPFPKGRWSRQGLLDSNPQSLQQRGDWAVCLPCACTVFKQGEIGCLSSLRHNGDKLALIKESPRHGQASLQTW